MRAANIAIAIYLAAIAYVGLTIGERLVAVL